MEKSMGSENGTVETASWARKNFPWRSVSIRPRTHWYAIWGWLPRLMLDFKDCSLINHQLLARQEQEVSCPKFAKCCKRYEFWLLEHNRAAGADLCQLHKVWTTIWPPRGKTDYADHTILKYMGRGVWLPWPRVCTRTHRLLTERAKAKESRQTTKISKRPASRIHFRRASETANIVEYGHHENGTATCIGPSTSTCLASSVVQRKWNAQKSGWHSDMGREQGILDRK